MFQIIPNSPCQFQNLCIQASYLYESCMHVNYWLQFHFEWHKWYSKSWSSSKLCTHVNFGAQFFMFNIPYARSYKFMAILYMHEHMDLKFFILSWNSLNYRFTLMVLSSITHLLNLQASYSILILCPILSLEPPLCLSLSRVYFKFWAKKCELKCK